MAIEKFCESFEKEILEEFDKAYEESDPRVMAVSFNFINACSLLMPYKTKQHCAKVLFEFNGGASCVQLYVNQHEFFMSNMKIEEIDQVRDSEE